MNEAKVFLSAMVPQPPVILAKDEDAALMIRASLHEDWSHVPDVVVMEEWPESWRVNAVVLTPVIIIGTDKFSSFTIDEDLSENARKVLNTYINVKRAVGGGRISYREIAKAAGLNRRHISNALAEMRGKNIGVVKDTHGFNLNIGEWRLDINKARAAGIEITEWK